MVLGGFGKTEIALSFIMGFRRAVYQIRGNVSLYYVVLMRMRLDLFIKNDYLKSNFFTFIF